MLKTSAWYQALETRKALLIFYGLMFLHLLIFPIFLNLEAGDGSVEGIELASFIFIFVLGLNSFKDSFHMFMQNGRSRKNLFFGYLLSLVPVCGIMALIDNIIGAVGQYTGHFETIFAGGYGDFFSGAGSPLKAFFAGLVWHFCLYVTCALAGYIITNFYYRAGKGLKILTSVGVPVTLFVFLPIVDTHLTHGAIGRFLLNFLELASGAKAGHNPFYPMGFSLLFAAGFAACSYLLQRRSIIKEAN